MAVTEQLYRLQQLDIDLEQHETALAEIRRKQQRNPDLEAADKRLGELRKREATTAAEQRSMESDLATLESKIKRDQSRMYGGQIVDPRELASLERELEHYQAERGALEERVLTSMDQLETLQKEVATTDRTSRELRERWDAGGPELTRQAEQLSQEVAQIREEREVLASSLDPRSLHQYERLQTSSRHAVSHVSNGVCQWCRVVIPQKDVQHARAGALVTCSNCARILYVGS
jgi:uncharacterized protein